MIPGRCRAIGAVLLNDFQELGPHHHCYQGAKHTQPGLSAYDVRHHAFEIQCVMEASRGIHALVLFYFHAESDTF